MIRTGALLFTAALALGGCASFPEAPSPTATSSIESGAVVSVDGVRLGLSTWKADEPMAVLIAVHGMNDYAGAFRLAGPFWAARGVSVYAYDQRGFGRSPNRGRWPGGDALKQDLRAVIAAVRAEHPELPVFVIGHSMGAGVILAAMKDAPLEVEGVVLAAPGIWGGASMPLFYRAALNTAAVFAPGETLTGERAERQASDNIEFLRTMFEDPLIIKETRVDTILGAVRIMGEGWDATDETGGRILFLYGEKDEIIPVKKMKKAAERLCGAVEIVAFPDSWHLIFADLERRGPLEATLAWITDAAATWRPQGRMGNPDAAVSSCAGKGGHWASAK